MKRIYSISKFILPILFFSFTLISCSGGGGGGSSSVAAPSALSYVGPNSLTVGTAATLSPSVTGEVSTWSVNPPLPQGLSLNTASGVITGTPKAATGLRSYTITATNKGGSATTVIELSVALSSSDAASANAANLIASYALSSRIVTLSWLHSFALATGYQVEQQNTDGTWTAIATVPSDSSTWIGDPINTSTTFRVEAILTGYLVPLHTVALLPQVQVVPPAAAPTLVVSGAQPIRVPIPISISGGENYVEADYFIYQTLIGTSEEAPSFAITFDPAVTWAGIHQIQAHLYESTDFYLVIQQSVQTDPQIHVSAGFTGVTGTVHAAVIASSDFGITQVSVALDGDPIGTLTAPNACCSHSRNYIWCLFNSCLNSYTFPVNTEVAGSGPHTLLVQVTDGNGVLATITSEVVFDNPPVATVNSPSDGAIVYGSLVLSGTSTSDKPGAVRTTVFLGDTQILSTTDSSFTTEYSLSGLAPGTYVIEVRSVDSTGKWTIVQKTITISSSPSLVYTPVMALGAGSVLLAVDQNVFLYKLNDGSVHLRAGTSDTVLQNVDSSLYYSTSGWRISNGSVFGQGFVNDSPPGTANNNVLMWSPAGVRSNLSAIAQSAGIDDALVTVHDDWVLWASQTLNSVVNWGTYYFYNLSSGQTVLVQVPSDAIGIGPRNVDFFLAPGGLTLYYWAWTSEQLDTEDIYRWDQSTGLSTRLTADGLTQVYPQTDGVRVAWQVQPAGTSSPFGCPYNTGCLGLSAYDIGSGVRQSLSQTMQNFFLADGLLAWKEGSPTGGGIKASDGIAVATLSLRLSAQLFGVSNGYVLYADNAKLYIWSAADGAQVLFDAVPPLAMISGNTVYFTNGLSQALYQVTLN